VSSVSFIQMFTSSALALPSALPLHLSPKSSIRLRYVGLRQLNFQSGTINTHARRIKNPKVPPCFSYLRSTSAIKPPRSSQIQILKSLDFPLLEICWTFPSRIEPLQKSSTYYYLPVIQPVFRVY